MNIRGDSAVLRAGGLNRSKRYPQGYRFPRRLEYEEASRGRPFLNPALEAKRGEVVEAMTRVLDEMATKWEANGE